MTQFDRHNHQPMDPAHAAFLRQLAQFDCGACGDVNLRDLAFSGETRANNQDSKTLLDEIHRQSRDSVSLALDALIRTAQFGFVIFGSKPLARGSVAPQQLCDSSGRVGTINFETAERLVRAFENFRSKLEFRLFEPFQLDNGMRGAQEIIVFRPNAVAAAIAENADLDAELCQPGEILQRLRTSPYLDEVFVNRAGKFREDVLGIVMGFHRNDVEFWQMRQDEANLPEPRPTNLYDRSCPYGAVLNSEITPVLFVAEQDSKSAQRTEALYTEELEHIEAILKSSDWLEKVVRQF